jgi:hypothetical protein
MNENYFPDVMRICSDSDSSDKSGEMISTLSGETGKFTRMPDMRFQDTKPLLDPFKSRLFISLSE